MEVVLLGPRAFRNLLDDAGNKKRFAARGDLRGIELDGVMYACAPRSEANAAEYDAVRAECVASLEKSAEGIAALGYLREAGSHGVFAWLRKLAG